MAWSTIRKASEEETQQLDAAVERIKARYGVYDAYWDMRDMWRGYHSYDDYAEKCRRAQSAYRRAVARILGGSAEGIAYGYVGYHVD